MGNAVVLGLKYLAVKCVCSLTMSPWLVPKLASQTISSLIRTLWKSTVWPKTNRAFRGKIGSVMNWLMIAIWSSHVLSDRSPLYTRSNASSWLNSPIGSWFSVAWFFSLFGLRRSQILLSWQLANLFYYALRDKCSSREHTDPRLIAVGLASNC